MGGLGSGRAAWPDEMRKPLVEDALTLDAAGLDWTGILEHPAGTFHWKNGLQEIAAMGYRVRREEHGDILVLQYTAKNHLDPFPVDVEEEIPLEETTPHFGGSRRWFSCPGCGSRVRTLHITQEETRLRCRVCQGLTFRSVRKHDKRVDELVRNPWKIKDQLSAIEQGGKGHFDTLIAFYSLYLRVIRARLRLRIRR